MTDAQCKYCNGSEYPMYLEVNDTIYKDGRKLIISDGKLQLVKRVNTVSFLCPVEFIDNVDISVTLNYCPICGRKL